VPEPGLICRPPWITLGPIKAAAMECPEFDYDLLVRPLESRMMRAVWRIVRQKEAAEDAFQDALAVIWKKRDAVARHPNPQALILKMTVDAWPSPAGLRGRPRRCSCAWSKSGRTRRSPRRWAARRPRSGSTFSGPKRPWPDG